MFKVDIPGKFYRYGEEGVLDQQQYADMANGSYYMVTRFKTNANFGVIPKKWSEKLSTAYFTKIYRGRS